MSAKSDFGLVLITGGNGFIGTHVARRMHADGCAVRVVDTEPRGYIPLPDGVEVMVGNLCNSAFCSRAVAGVTTVLHLAANMGGMGVIHSENDFIIYQENHIMTTNIVAASIASGVRLFLYGSSACVYPDSLQGVHQLDVSLKEGDVYADLPPRPQGLYGLEKLHSEHLLQCVSSRMEVRIARFHNIFGPGGSWMDGREKVPAALLRKALAAKRVGDCPVTIELWGDGTQKRSFCFVDDAVDGMIRLLHSRCCQPVNIGSNRAVTIRELADIAIRTAGIDMNQKIQYRLLSDKPVGVGSRNSNNDFVQTQLGWQPTTNLEDGMRATARWISQEIDELLCRDADQDSTLRKLQVSKIIDLQRDAITFAILLPVTSRGTSSPDDCLRNLTRFARSLRSTTQYDVGKFGKRYHVHIYIAIDHDDRFLLEPDGSNKVEEALQVEGFSQLVTLVSDHPQGQICALWRDLARKAWEDGCDYFTLMGDDIVLEDANWQSAICDAFEEVGRREDVPIGFGCVAFTDISFPGMPTFPVLHRTHMEIFEGSVVPQIFVNQDGDPFLYQLYRRWNCSTMIPSRLRNKTGGSDDARYKKVSASLWTFTPLDIAVSTAQGWLERRSVHIDQKLSLDVVIPCYRVNMAYLDRFLALVPSTACTVMFIIIIDDPNSPNIDHLWRKYSHRPDVRIRTNVTNMGASASRNRGLKESSAEWVIFLDDDVSPQADILVEAEKIIRSHPDAAGFVGTALFPAADTIATGAIHLAGVTYFWDIARKRRTDEDLPWGVTANLIARRNVLDHVEFDLTFPKTGGGEDIDFCRRKRNFSIKQGRRGFLAAPDVVVTHPWWNQGRRSYWRFYMWSKGDSGLISKYPEFAYTYAAPNSAELFVMLAMATSAGFATTIVTDGYEKAIATLLVGTKSIISLLVSNIFHDLYRHLWSHSERVAEINLAISGVSFVAAIVESTLIRIFSEYGRLVGLIERREYSLIMTGFDWFTGRAGDGPRKEENANRVARIMLWVTILAVVLTW